MRYLPPIGACALFFGLAGAAPAATVASARPQAMPPALLVEIQTALSSDSGARLLSLDGSLGALQGLDTELLSHRQALAPMAAELGTAREFKRDFAASPPLAAADLIQAFHSQDNRARIESVLRGRVEELRAAEGQMAPREKRAAAAELEALAGLGSGQPSNRKMAAAVRSAQRLAKALGATGEDDPVAAKNIKWIPVLSLRPMQFAAGMIEVADKAAELRRMSPAQQRKFLLEHPIPVVERSEKKQHVNKGPMSRKEDRPDDHHHLARAAWEAGITKIPVKVEERVGPKKGSKRKFWKKMKKGKLVYLYDQFGEGPRNPEDLPRDVRGLADDPYRSIAGRVRDLGGYRKTHEPFAEFRWANFFREHLETHPHRDYKAAVQEAMRLARSRDAKDLPGYIREKK